MEQLLQNTYWTLAEDLRPPKRQETPHVPSLGKRKKKKQRQKNQNGTCTSGRELWRRKSFHTLGSPFTGGDGGWRGGSFGATEESAATGVQRAKRRDSHTEISADQHSPAWEACLLTRQDGWGLGAEAWASEVGSQGEDWGWLGEHSLKRASVPQLAGRESGKKSGPAEEARDHCFGGAQGEGSQSTS